MRRFVLSLSVLLTLALISLPVLSQDVISTAIGGGPNNIPALDANLYNPVGIAVDSAGNVYIASFYQHRVFKVNSAGKILVVAGSGAQGFSGDGVAGGAAAASLWHPYAVALDPSGNIYIDDQYNCVIRKVDSTNTITTIAGTPQSCGYSGDGGKAISAQLNFPAGVVVDGSGNLFIGDNNNCVVRRVALSSNTITTYAGNHSCGYSGDGGSATVAQLSVTTGVALDGSGNLFLADSGNCVIREGPFDSKDQYCCGQSHLRLQRRRQFGDQRRNESGLRACCERNHRDVSRLLQPAHPPVHRRRKYHHGCWKRCWLLWNLRRGWFGT